MEFKANFHHVSIHARKDSENKWYDLPYLATENAITVVLDRWLVDWCTASDLTAGSSKFAAQRKKDEAKLKMEQLATKRKSRLRTRPR